MGWFPIGPNFVFAPRAAFARLSRRNEGGRQGLVSCIAVETGDPNTIYVVVRPATGGSSMFLTRDGGASWVPISDGLRTFSANADPSYVAIHPVNPAIIYVGSFDDNAVYISNNRGAAGSWTGPHSVGAYVLKVVVDPRHAMDPLTTVFTRVPPLSERPVGEAITGQLEEEAEKLRYIPPWIEEAMENRELEVGKKIDPRRRAPLEDDDDDNPPPG